MFSVSNSNNVADGMQSAHLYRLLNKHTSEFMTTELKPTTTKVCITWHY